MPRVATIRQVATNSPLDAPAVWRAVSSAFIWGVFSYMCLVILEIGQERAQQVMIACQGDHITLPFRPLGENLTIPACLFGYGVTKCSRQPMLDAEGSHLERATGRP